MNQHELRLYGSGWPVSPWWSGGQPRALAGRSQTWPPWCPSPPRRSPGITHMELTREPDKKLHASFNRVEKTSHPILTLDRVDDKKPLLTGVDKKPHLLISNFIDSSHVHSASFKTNLMRVDSSSRNCIELWLVSRFYFTDTNDY